MKDRHISTIKERQHVTKEFADTITAKTPSPYFRLHDPVQKRLVEYAMDGEILQQTEVREYCQCMIHFWREVSLAGMPRAGRAMDECYALLFESAFDLAEAEPTWALGCLAEKSASELPAGALNKLASHTVRGTINHAGLIGAFTDIYAPAREAQEKYHNEVYVPLEGTVWFCEAVSLTTRIDETHELWPFRCALARSSRNGWGDHRLHTGLIREAPQRAPRMSRLELMAHPILRLAKLKYREGSLEQAQVLRFLNGQCIKQGFESEEDCFGSDLTLAQWARDARHWATNLSDAEPEVCQNLFHEAGEKALDRTRNFYYHRLGSDPTDVDSLDVTAGLIKWAKQRRGFEFSQYRAQLWEFVVEIVDAALWLGWLFPVPSE